MSSSPTWVPTSIVCGFRARDRRSSPESTSQVASCQRMPSPETRRFSERHVLAVRQHCSIVSLACSSVLQTIRFIRSGLISSLANTNSLFYTPPEHDIPERSVRSEDYNRQRTPPVAERWRVADGSREAAEEVPLSQGEKDRGNPVRREPWQGHRNDTDPADRMIR